MVLSEFCANDTSSHNDIFLNGFSNQEWNGIVLYNCDELTRIENAKFYDTKSPIRIDNNNVQSAYNSKIIRRNFFDISENSKAIYVHNQYYMWIDSNTFDISSYENTVAVYYLNSLILGPEAAAILAEAEQSYNINITNNLFSGGLIPLLINGLGTNLSSPYIYNNKFENTGLYGIAGLKISGAIKQNTFMNPSENYCVYLSQSNPDLYSNIFKSEKRNMILYSSFPNLSPFRNGNQHYWTAGKIIFRSILTLLRTFF